MDRPLKVVIVGGGTAGWMAAAALVGRLSPTLCQVRLVESEEIGIVGVGEATLPHMRDFNKAVGIIEADMMSRTAATFKLGIQFVDWGYQGSSYFHPFGSHGRPVGGIGFHHQWLRAVRNGYDGDFEDFSYAIVASRMNRFDFPVADQAAINSTYDYAYQFDAGRYARFLREFAEARGLTRTEGRITTVDLDPESGAVTGVRLESGARIEGDFFIDCSGFRSLLLGEALGSAFEEWGRWLPCDRALAVPCERTEPLTPYTRSTAREAGWQWRIPLQHRTGNGYVFSSAFTDEERAAETLLANLDGKALAEPRLLRFRSGRRLQSWKKNCMGVGLSSGFLEPLESTSIYLIQVAITNFIELFPEADMDPALAREFNRRMDVEYSRIRDFLILHYHANRRDEPLWRHCREMDVPDSLREKIALFEHGGYVEQYKQGLFSQPSWLSVFLGQGVRPRQYHRMADNLALDAVVAELDGLRARIRERVKAMPSHAEIVADHCASFVAA